MKKIIVTAISAENYQKWVDHGQKENADLVASSLSFDFPVDAELIGDRIVINNETYLKDWFVFHS